MVKKKRETCKYCDGKLEAKTTRREFCSPKCKVYWHRDNSKIEPIEKDAEYYTDRNTKKEIKKDKELTTVLKEINQLSNRPKNLEELKKMCPPELIGFDRSEWISNERKKYNI